MTLVGLIRTLDKQLFNWNETREEHALYSSVVQRCIKDPLCPEQTRASVEKLRGIQEQQLAAATYCQEQIVICQGKLNAARRNLDQFLVNDFGG